MRDKTAEELAEEHWKWLETLLHKIFVDGMVHGFGHGYEAGINGRRVNDKRRDRGVNKGVREGGCVSS